MTTKGENLSRLHVATVFFLRSKGQKAEKLLKLIRVQNPELLTDTIEIGPESCKAIKAKEFTIQGVKKS